MTRAPRASLLLVLALLAGMFATVSQPSAPPASAAEGSSVEGNYVQLPKPVRILNRGFKAGESFSFTALGLTGTGIPRAGTMGLVVVVTGSNNTDNTGVSISPYSSTGWYTHQVEAVKIEGTQKYPVSNTVTVSVDETRTTNHLTVREDWDASPVTVQVDVLGYYTKNAVGSGLIPVRPATLFDTRTGSATPVPAGGSINMQVTGGVVPTGADTAFMDLVATNITANGGVVAVPTGASTAANPVMRFGTGAGAISNLVAVKVGATGSVTFKNTSTGTVHLLARAVGYTLASPVVGAGWRVARSSYWESTVPANGKVDIQASNTFTVPATGVGGIFANIDIYGTTGSGYLKIYPSGQAASSTSLVNFGGMTSVYRHRQSGAILVPGSNGKITVENVSAKPITLALWTHAWFTAPTDYAPEGTRKHISVAHTSLGPCYGYVHPTVYDVRVWCTEGYESDSVVVSTLSPTGHKFSGPATLVARPNGRFVVTALHAPDGEVWTWELAHSTGVVTPTPVRSFRHTVRPLVTATLPSGAPVGFTSDVEGRVWAVDLNVQAPGQPTWKMLEIPSAVLVGELTATSTPDGIRLGAVTVSGDVVTGLYAAGTSTSLDWQSLGASGAKLGTQVAIGVSQTGQARVAVAHSDNTMWSASVAATGGTVDGWHQVNTTYNGTPVTLEGSPTITYDPLAGENVLLFWSDVIGTGAYYRVRENAPGTGVFDQPVLGTTTTSGVSSDLTAWDYRTDAPPISRRWTMTYLDDGNAQQAFTSMAN